MSYKRFKTTVENGIFNYGKGSKQSGYGRSVSAVRGSVPNAIAIRPQYCVNNFVYLI